MEDLTRLYERLYEDNVSGKVTDEWFLQLSRKYEVERMDPKTKTARLRQQLAEADSAEQDQQRFLRAVRKFLEMDTLTAPLLSELVEKIIVHETEGTGRNRTQRIEICYRFIGYLDIPEVSQSPIYMGSTSSLFPVRMTSPVRATGLEYTMEHPAETPGGNSPPDCCIYMGSSPSPIPK